ncbi:MAG: AAA family ATPase [Bacteroidota bacterium]
MYIAKIEIDNIRSIRHFEMAFEDPAGWHVLIGDNGAGKSSIIRSIALALVGPEQALGLRADWKDWLNNQSDEGSILLCIENQEVDKQTGSSAPQKNKLIPNELIFKRNKDLVSLASNVNKKSKEPNPIWFNWGQGTGWFSVAYGPYRRFAGGNQEWTKVFYSQPKLGAHLSAFGEDIAFIEATEWLVKLNYQQLEQKTDSTTIKAVKELVNSSDFLPHGSKLSSISSSGVIFTDGNGADISVMQMSDGYRSILSLTFELIRQLVRVYDEKKVFGKILKGNMVIDLPGVVLIDEVDAHLHPSWQTRIGQWFTKYFPKIQFIVTTHSPLICRAAEKGTIWRLAAPGSEGESGEITGTEKECLIYGNILDAYGTELFGTTPVRSAQSNEKLDRLGKLNMLSALGKISQKEENERLMLQTTLSTDDPTGF